MLHLTEADYLRQPWKNGRGTTTELWRFPAEGAFQVRLSRAAVVEDGPFSVFPGIERNLTVLSGPGFRLTGAGLDFRCDPLVPVAFPGAAALAASDTRGQPSEDFNVMTDARLPLPQVTVLQNGPIAPGGILALHALGTCRVNGRAMSPGDTTLTDASADLTGDAPVILMRLLGLPTGVLKR